MSLPVCGLAAERVCPPVVILGGRCLLYCFEEGEMGAVPARHFAQLGVDGEG